MTGARERVVVALTDAGSGDALVRRAAQMAGTGDLLGVHVRSPDRATPEATGSEPLEERRALLVTLGGSFHEVVSGDVASALVSFAQAEGATQLVLGATRRSRWAELTRGSVINTVIRQAAPIDVHVISTGDDVAALQPTPARRGSMLSRRRRGAGWAVGLAGTALLTTTFTETRSVLGNEARSLLYLMLVLVAAAIGGTGPALATSILAAAALNWFFTPRLYTWSVADVENLIALVVFVLAGVGVSLLVTQVARRSHEAARARGEAEALARAAGGLVGEDDPLPAILDGLRTSLGFDSVALLVAGDEGTWRSSARAGPRAPESPGEASMRLDLPDGSLLALRGPLGLGEGRILRAFAAQLAAAIDRRRLRDEAARADALAEGDALRTALLRAVSHDLRTPLASIKASVTSLLQGDVAWSTVETKEFLATIDEETDRLNRLVGNLLDMSRLQVGAIRPDPRLVAVEEVVAVALASISGLDGPVEVEVPGDLPLVRADPVLLERALANVVTNALTVSPPATPVRLEARRLWSDVVIEVADHGPGVPVEARERIFEPFQRLDDRGGGGVGLGLAVARGLVEVMGGTIAADDTPGGGLTMVVTLRGAPDGR